MKKLLTIALAAALCVDPSIIRTMSAIFGIHMPLSGFWICRPIAASISAIEKFDRPCQ